MKKFEEFWTPCPITDDISALSDPSLRADRDREQVNECVLNTVIKYLKLYLEIADHNVRTIRNQVLHTLARKNRMIFEMHPVEGMQYDALFGYRRPGNDGYGLLCAADLHRTAAIFKEIVFGGRFEANGKFVGLELGSGTGILMLAMALAAKRREIEDLFIVGIESSGMAATQSQKTLEPLLGSEHVSVLCEDILNEGKLVQLFKKPIHYWVSETISLNTTSLNLNRSDFGLSKDELLIRSLECSVDPYIEALRVSMKELPRFRQEVEKGKTAMFPDIFNGLYKPNGGKSKLKLTTTPDPKHVILERAGAEFEAYEDFSIGEKRWDSPDDMEVAIESQI